MGKPWPDFSPWIRHWFRRLIITPRSQCCEITYSEALPAQLRWKNTGSDACKDAYAESLAKRACRSEEGRSFHAVGLTTQHCLFVVQAKRSSTSSARDDVQRFCGQGTLGMTTKLPQVSYFPDWDQDLKCNALGNRKFWAFIELLLLWVTHCPMSNIASCFLATFINWLY